MCTACQNRVNGMKNKKKKRRVTRRRRSIRGLDSQGITQLFTDTVLPGAGGAVAAAYIPKMLVKAKQEKMAKNSNYIAVLAGGLLAATQKGPVGAFGAGMAISGTAGVINDLLDGSDKTGGGANGLGLLPGGVPSYRILGNPAQNQAQQNQVAQQVFKVQ